MPKLSAHSGCVLTRLKADMRKLADPAKAAVLSRFFKTGKGQYGCGDVFLGIMVPAQRALAKRYRDMGLPDLAKLLASPIHEHRLTALIILEDQCGRADEAGKKRIFDFYLSHTRCINNWDLVDLSAPSILGGYLLHRPDRRRILLRLARSASLWERRMAVLATLTFIRAGRFDDTLLLAEMLLGDAHDLMHKAIGWMLREAGKRNVAVLETFLDAHASTMPRTMLRYAIERLPERKRKSYLAAGKGSQLRKAREVK